jgi:hypothetical protein
MEKLIIGAIVCFLVITGVITIAHCSGANSESANDEAKAYLKSRGTEFKDVSCNNQGVCTVTKTDGKDFNLKCPIMFETGKCVKVVRSIDLE